MRSHMARALTPAGQTSSAVTQSIGRMRHELLSQFHVAFVLMSIIPLLLCLYLITVKFFSLEILQGMNGLYFLLAVVFSMIQAREEYVDAGLGGSRGSLNGTNPRSASKGVCGSCESRC